MKNQTVLLTMAALLASGLTAAKRDRDWQTGTVMASRTVNVGAVAREAYPSIGYGPSATVSRTMTTAELELFGSVYAYTIRDLGIGWPVRRGCRYIVGDGVKYVQEKAVLYLIDADGKECRAQIMTQERIPADVKSVVPPTAPAKP